MSPADVMAIRRTIQARNIELRAMGVEVGVNTQVWGYVDVIFPERVTIGRNCVLSGQSAILTHGLEASRVGGLPVVICDNVFIGYGAIILPGVVVNTCSIVGAGAVVTKDVPEMSVVAGNPARVIGERDRLELSQYIKDREAGELL